MNAGFCSDKLITPEDSDWVHKNKEHGKISAIASLGMVMQWNADEGMIAIDKYLYFDDNQVKAGALLAMGVANAGFRDDCDAVFGLMPEHLESKDESMRSCAALALGAAYANNPKAEVLETLIQF